jgi:hypothetical protein
MADITSALQHCEHDDAWINHTRCSIVILFQLLILALQSLVDLSLFVISFSHSKFYDNLWSTGWRNVNYLCETPEM